jgi:hypothetical protein
LRTSDGRSSSGSAVSVGEDGNEQGFVWCFSGKVGRLRRLREGGEERVWRGEELCSGSVELYDQEVVHGGPGAERRCKVCTVFPLAAGGGGGASLNMEKCFGG